MCLVSLVGAVALTVAVGGAPAVQADSSADASVASSSEAFLVERINAVREQHGLSTLRVKPDLASHARAHSALMSRQHTLVHTLSFRVLCCWSSIAENIAYNGSARGAHRALMNSAPHRANILDPDMRGIGVGVERVGGILWVTEVFRQPRP